MNSIPPTAPLRNRLASLAEDVREDLAAGRRLSVEGAERYLRAAAALAEARDEARRGEWAVFLSRADVKPSTARLMIQIHRAGMDAATLADVGVRGAQAWLSGAAEPPADGDAGDAAGEAAQDAEPGAGGPFPGPVGGEKPPTVGGNEGAPGGPRPNDGATVRPSLGATPAGDRRRYRARRSAGECVECGAPSGAAARCERCRATVSERRRRRRALAGIGDALAGRIEEAARDGREAVIDADEAAALAKRLAGKEG